MQRIKTGSVNETLRIQSALREQMTGAHTGGAAFTWRASHVHLRDVVVSTSAYTGSVRGYAPEVGKYWISITQAAGGEVLHGRTTAAYAVGTGNILSPGRPAAIELGDNFRGLLVGIPPGLVAHALAALDGGPFAPPRFGLAVDWRSGPAADLARLVRFLAEEGERGSGLFDSPVIAARLEETLVHALLRLPHDRMQPPVKAPGFALDTVRRVEDYMAAHAASPITLAELAGVARTGIRTLQAMFRRHRGYAPMEFLRVRRFELARARLASGDPATIAEIALDCGFTHLGRFSTAYRVRFGERPTDTRQKFLCGTPRSSLR